jgi:hypothetical protein
MRFSSAAHALPISFSSMPYGPYVSSCPLWVRKLTFGRATGMSPLPLKADTLSRERHVR